MRRIVGPFVAPALLFAAALASPSPCTAAPAHSVFLGAYSASGTNDAQVGSPDFDLAVIPAGLGYVVDTCDQPSGTTYLRVFDEDGTQLAQGSGGCPAGSGTRLVVTAPGTSRHHVRAGCAGDSSCTGRVTASSSVPMVERWTPVMFQDTFPGTYFVPGDYITNFNFDGDYDGSNNWDHGDQISNPAVSFKGHVYYSRVETTTHDFLGYYFFHPQDRSCLTQHENDLEGILLAVRKTGLYGDLVAMETEAHGHTYQYVTPGLGTTESPAGTAPDGSIFILPDQAENPLSDTVVASPLSMAGHPMIYVEPGGHGVWACGDAAQDANCGDNDGMVYAWEGGGAEDPNLDQCDDGTAGHFNLLNACGYRLVSLDDWGGSSTVADPGVTQGLWVLQNHICPNCTFHSFTNFRGNGEHLDDDPCGANFDCTCADNAANPPWQWRDHGGVGNGDWLSDPARLFDIDFEGPEFEGAGFSHDYTRHNYYTHELEIVRSRVTAPEIDDVPGLGMYVRGETLPASGNEGPVLLPYHWQKIEPGVGTSHDWSYGADDATGENAWSTPDLNRHRFTRQTQVRHDDGGFTNGGRTVSVSVQARIPAGFGTIEVPMVTRDLGPNDWSSGTCGLDDDSGCVGPAGAFESCRVQVNDFTCDGGATAPNADVEFRLTRIRRPSAPPVAKAGGDQSLECASPNGTQVALDGSGSSDPEGDPLTYSWSAPGVTFASSGSAATSALFPLGTTEVTLTVSDGTQEASDIMVVTVADTTPPSVTLGLVPPILDPPRHQLVPVTAQLTVTDACDPGAPTVSLQSVTSSEPDNGTGDGDTDVDIQGAAIGTADDAFLLRAERAGNGDGRIYRVLYAVRDANGNVVLVEGTVTVPRR